MNFLFWKNGTYDTFNVVPQIYTNLKLICHVSLGTYTLLYVVTVLFYKEINVLEQEEPLNGGRCDVPRHAVSV